MTKDNPRRRPGVDRRAEIISSIPSISDARVDVVLQRIEELVGDEIEVEPKHVRRYGINNIFQRVFSYLLAKKSDGKYIQLEATLAGALKVASVGAGLEYTERKTGTATEVLSEAVVFSQVISRLDVYVETYEMYISPSPDGVTFYDYLRCIPGVRNIFDISMKSFKVLRAGLNDVNYEIVGEW